jgi:hypothetical protein
MSYVSYFFGVMLDVSFVMLNVSFVSFLLGVDIRVDINHMHQLFSPSCYFLFAYVDVISKNHYPHMRIQITILGHQHTLYIYIYI